MKIKFIGFWIVITFLGAGIVGIGLAKVGSNMSASVAEADSTVADAPSFESIVATVGDDAGVGGNSSQNSWSGTILSLGTVPVQPTRDGSIVSWMVKIGDSVYAGQPIAKLSEPPAMPELVAMLATEAKMLTEKRAQLETTKQFVEKNNAQLKTQLASLERSRVDSNTLLSGNNSIELAKDTVRAMRGEIRSFLDQMVSEHVNTITNTHIASLYRGGSIYAAYGMLDQETRNTADTNLFRLITALKDTQSLPLDEATQYLASAVRMAHSSVFGEGVEDIRPMMKEDQAEFLAMVAKYKDAEADVSMQATEYENMNLEQKRMLVNDRKMIEEKIAENEKMLAMSEAEAKAAEASYAAVENGSRGGLYIKAPLSGTVSTIDKNAGEFVGPGMPIARITSANGSTQPFVRFRIPGNIRTPKVGEVLKVVRPGFSRDVKEVRVTGVGASLDSGGMYMADASFTEQIAWPIDASVRIIAPDNSTGIIIKASSVWWNSTGEPQVWAVSEAGRIFARKITIGRTLGAQIEVYDGLAIGDRYILKPTPEIREDMLLEEIAPAGMPSAEGETAQPKSGEHDNMPGM
ncbi:MAG: hypothetical protein WC764_00325 [Candidatus Paceibacterota bacterium]|jgi:multidrug efflux pump subunit AcrA (membrane-fusion protein)